MQRCWVCEGCDSVLLGKLLSARVPPRSVSPATSPGLDEFEGQRSVSVGLPPTTEEARQQKRANIRQQHDDTQMELMKLLEQIREVCRHLASRLLATRCLTGSLVAGLLYEPVSLPELLPDRRLSGQSVSLEGTYRPPAVPPALPLHLVPATKCESPCRWFRTRTWMNTCSLRYLRAV